MRVHSILALTCGIALPACSLYFEQDPGAGDGPPAPTCELRAADAGIPGYPFDFPYYVGVVWPLTQRGCASSGGCHDARDGFSRGFEVWPQDDDPCSANRSFNAFYDYSDYVRWPADSLVLLALDGGLPTHPVQPGRNSEDYSTLSNFIEDAWFEYADGARQTLYFDMEVFQTEIQPMLDAAGCASAGCHDVYTTPNGFGLYGRPARGSSEMYANFDVVTLAVEFSAPPDQTSLFTQATNWHGGSGVDNAAALLSWIMDGFWQFNRYRD